jgi:hypothetical protein
LSILGVGVYVEANYLSQNSSRPIYGIAKTM